MCQFYSAIVTKTGELYHNPWTTSHEDIVAVFDLKDEKDNLCRVEFYPDIDEDIWDYKKYNLHIDQQEPEWFKKFQTKTISKLKLIIKNMIVTGEKQMLCGKVIILKDAKIGTLKNVLVYDMISSRVGKICGSSQVGKICGSSQVGEMCGSSQVGKMCGSSQVGEMCSSSRVGEMYGSSRVGEMCGSSRVGEMYDSSQVGKMCGSSWVGEMYDSSQVGEMYGNSQVPKDKKPLKDLR